mmetsp:Transcript_25973/g.28887  ORF Transcript_25973/g.28887 Transcript_25973/m.28887 type:complete len:123 (-) Transcript_25973:79-447(-)
MAKTCPFLDGKHWQVHVSLLKTGLEIKHVKNQRHVAQEFEFEWQLVLTFDLELTSLTKMYLNIIDWTFTEKATEKTKQNFLSVTAPYVLPWLLTSTPNSKKPRSFWRNQFSKLVDGLKKGGK